MTRGLSLAAGMTDTAPPPAAPVDMFDTYTEYELTSEPHPNRPHNPPPPFVSPGTPAAPTHSSRQTPRQRNRSSSTSRGTTSTNRTAAAHPSATPPLVGPSGTPCRRSTGRWDRLWRRSRLRALTTTLLCSSRVITALPSGATRRATCRGEGARPHRGRAATPSLALCGTLSPPQTMPGFS